MSRHTGKHRATAVHADRIEDTKQRATLLSGAVLILAAFIWNTGSAKIVVHKTPHLLLYTSTESTEDIMNNVIAAEDVNTGSAETKQDKAFPPKRPRVIKKAAKLP